VLLLMLLLMLLLVLLMSRTGHCTEPVNSGVSFPPIDTEDKLRKNS
jgi:hypothetical protein